MRDIQLFLQVTGGRAFIVELNRERKGAKKRANIERASEFSDAVKSYLAE